MKVRKAGVNDISNIQHVAYTTWKDTYEGLISKEVQDSFLKMAYSDDAMIRRVKGTLLFVAEVDNNVVGFANFSNVNPENNSAVLAAIYILPTYQNLKIGSLLLEKGLQALVGAETLFVEVEKDNEVGKRFYMAKGFDFLEEYKEDFYGHQLETVRMSLNLGNR